MSPENETGLIVAVALLVGVGIIVVLIAATAYIVWSNI